MTTIKTETDVNTLIFSKMIPAKKLDIVNHLTDEELLKVSSNTILRIVKSIGVKSRNYKTLFLVNHISNNLNAEVLSVWTDSNIHNINLDICVQYYNTDITKVVSMSDFMKAGDYVGQLTYTDINSGMQTVYFKFDVRTKALLVKDILRAYLIKRFFENVE